MSTYRQYLQELMAQNTEPSEISAAILAYARRGLTWAFGERLESTGYFQHSFVPDFTVLIGEEQVDFHLRFDPLACLSLLSSEERSQSVKKVVLLLVPGSELDDAYSYLKQYKDRRTILITSVETLDFLSGLATRFQMRQTRSLETLAEDIERWFADASGIVGGVELERYCRASLMMANLSREPDPVLPGTLTIGFHRHRGNDLCQALALHPVFKQAIVRELSDKSWDHPFRGQTGWPDMLVTYQSFDSERALFSVYLDRHLPVGFNSFQEFGRAAASARLGIPFAVIAPHRGLVEREAELSSIEIASPLVYHAYLRLWDIYRIPVVFLPWPTDQDGRLIFDRSIPSLPPTDDPVFQHLMRLMETAIQAVGHQFSEDLLQHHSFQRVRLNMEGKRLTRGVDYVSRPHLRSLEYHRSEELLRKLLENFPGLQESPPTWGLLNRPRTILMASNSKTLRSDPYLGTLEMFDFAFCRYGPEYRDRRRNLGIRFPRVSYTQALELLNRRSERPEVRSPRLFFEYCDIILLEDATLLRRSSDSFVAYVLDGNVVEVPLL